MINKVTLIGRLGSDPEMTYTNDQTPIAKFSVATTSSYKKEEQTEWHRITFFGKVAEVCGLYLKKGALVYIEGRLRTNEWEDKNGVKRSTTEIIGGELKMLDKKKKEDEPF